MSHSNVNSIGSPTINMPFSSVQDGGQPQAAPSGGNQSSGVPDILSNNFQGISNILGGPEGGGGGLLNLNIVPNILSSNTNTQSGGGQKASAPAASAPAPAAPSGDAVAELPQAPASNCGQSNDAPRFVSNNFQGIVNAGRGSSDAPRSNDASRSVSNNFQGITNAGGSGSLLNLNFVANVASRNESTQAA